MRMPVDDLFSNWAYMVMSALAWNLKAGMDFADAQSPTGSGVTRDGVPSFPASHRALTGSDRPQWAADNLPNHGLQQLA